MRHELAAVEAFLVDAIQRRKPIPDDAKIAETSAELVTGNDRLSPAEQVDIYRWQFVSRHRSLLRGEFPGLAHILGPDRIDGFCVDFYEAHPPATHAFRVMFEPLLGFVETYAGFVSAEERALAVEMTRYELALMDILVGGDAPPLDPAKLAGLPEDAWERARIVLHPLFTSFAFDYPVHRLLKAWITGEDMARPEAPAPVYVALYRTREVKTHFEELEPEAFALLSALRSGVPLVPALEQVAASLPPERQELVGASVGVWFQQWTAWGIVIDVVL